MLRGVTGEVRGVDHGLTFNADDKLRTVLWGWAGDPLTTQERDALRTLEEQLAPAGELAGRLHPLLRLDEVARTRERVAALLEQGCMPETVRALAGHPVASHLRVIGAPIRLTP